MKAWELLKHLEEGGKIRSVDEDEESGYYYVGFNELSGWDYDPIRNPKGWEIPKERDPIKIGGWVNVYECNVSSIEYLSPIFTTKSIADIEESNNKRIACIKVTGEEVDDYT